MTKSQTTLHHKLTAQGKRNGRLVSRLEGLINEAGKKTCVRIKVDDAWRLRAALHDYDRVLARLKDISPPVLRP